MKNNRWTMKRKLSRQICAEWRSNIWLFVELLVVSLVLWWINDYFYAVRQIRVEPYGFDTRGVYKLSYAFDYSKQDGLTDSVAQAQVNAVMARLRAEPAISSAALSCGITPHNYNFQGGPLFLASDSGLCVGIPGHGLPRCGIDGRGDICQTLGITGANGETPAELDRILAGGKALITSNVRLYNTGGGDVPPEKAVDASNVVGKVFNVNAFGGAPVMVGGVILPQKRATYESAADMVCILLPQNFYFGLWGDILVRVKDDYPGDFAADLRQRLARDYSLEYIYLTDVEDMEEIRVFNDRDMDQQERLYMAMCVFLMVNVFLGLLGSFWFRTQQRASEIAIRMVSGASPRHIIARVLAEPLLLLLATVPFAAAVVWLLRGAEEFVSQQVELDVLHAVGVVGAATYAEMALMVVLGVLFPAVKAMRMRPAAVLQEE